MVLESQALAISRVPLLKAVNDEDVQELRELLDAGADPLEQRGALGETALHMCLLLHGQTHCEMAEVLVKEVGEPLVNAPYAKQPFLGETALHIAVVKRDEELARLLIANGADLHARAVGTFFATGKDGCECPYGELPLSFAAATGQTALCRILLGAGADLYAKDAEGNTALHIAVRFARVDVYEFLVEWEADLKREVELRADGRPDEQQKAILARSLREQRNKDLHSPISLATKLGDIQMFTKALSLEKKVLWRYGTVIGCSYRLATLDEVVQVMISSGSHELVLHPLVMSLLNRWWAGFGRSAFAVSFYEAVFYLIVFSIAAVFGEKVTEGVSTESSKSWVEHLGNYAYITANVLVVVYLIRELFRIRAASRMYHARQRLRERQAGLLDAHGHSRVSNAVAGVVGTISTKHVRGCRQRCRRAMWHAGQGASSVDQRAKSGAVWMRRFLWVHIGFVLASIPARMSGEADAADACLAMAAIFGFLYLFSFAAGHPFTGHLVAMITRMASVDVPKFMLIYMLVIVGYSQAFQLIMRNATAQSFSSTPTAASSLIRMSLGDWSYEDFSDASYPWLAHIFFFSFLVLSAVMLLNLLIALMAETYSRVSDNAERTFRFQWAVLILEYEAWLPESKRNRRNLTLNYGDGSEEAIAKLMQDSWHVTERLSESEYLEYLAEEAAHKRAARTAGAKLESLLEERRRVVDRAASVFASRLHSTRLSKKSRLARARRAADGHGPEVTPRRLIVEDGNTRPYAAHGGVVQ